VFNHLPEEETQGCAAPPLHCPCDARTPHAAPNKLTNDRRDSVVRSRPAQAGLPRRLAGRRPFPHAGYHQPAHGLKQKNGLLFIKKKGNIGQMAQYHKNFR